MIATPLSSNEPRLMALRMLRRMERDAASCSLLDFARLYLGDHFKLPPSRMHQEVAQLLEEASEPGRSPVGKPPNYLIPARRGPGRRIAVAAPRGHAKSTLVSMAYVLWSLCFGREEFIILCSNTGGQAQELLDHVKRELTQNEALRAAFPHVCEPTRKRPMPPRWRKEEIVTCSGARVLALGQGMAVRGRRHRTARPTLIICDDLESDEGTASPDRRAKTLDWFTRTVLNAGQAGTNFVVVGTILHADSLLARLVDPDREPVWDKRLYKAIETFSVRTDLWGRWEALMSGKAGSEWEPCGQNQLEPSAAGSAFFDEHEHEMLKGTKVLWPEKEDYPELMRTRLEVGRYAFSAEKQNDPVSPDDSLLAGTDVVYWDDQFPSVDALLGSMRPDDITFYVGCDPSLSSKPGKGDPSAIIVVARDARKDILYVLEADIRHRAPSALVHAILEWAEKYPLTGVVFENNGFQELLVGDLERQARLRRLYMNIKRQTNHSPKLLRIQSLQPVLNSGRLHLRRSLIELNEQLERFPRAKHDDGPDALHMVTEYAIARRHGGGRVSLDI